MRRPAIVREVQGFDAFNSQAHLDMLTSFNGCIVYFLSDNSFAAHMFVRVCTRVVETGEWEL